MPFIFDGTSLPAEAGLDPEELKKLQQQQAQAKQQASQAPQKASQPAAAGKPQPAAKPQQPQQGGTQPGPYAPQQLAGVGKWVEENIGIPGADLIDNLFGGNQKTPDQIGVERANQRAVGAEKLLQFDAMSAKDPAAEIIRGTAGGVEDFYEGIINLPGQLSTLAGNEYKPFRSNIIKENNTQAGEGLRTITRYVTGGITGSAVTKGAFTAGQTGAALFGGRMVQGFIEDFAGADGTAEDDTLIGKTPFTQFLQTADTNNPIHNRALVGIEGALFEAVGGSAVDSVRKIWQSRRAVSKLQKATELSQRLGKLETEYGIQLSPVSTTDEFSRVMEQTRQMLADPDLAQRQKAQKAMKLLEDVAKRKAIAENAESAHKRLNELIVSQFRNDNFGETLDFSKQIDMPAGQLDPEVLKITEYDNAMRVLAADPSRKKLNELITAAAGDGEGAAEIREALRARVEMFPAVDELDRVANTIQYGGDPDELVYSGRIWKQADAELEGFDKGVGQLDDQLKALQAELDLNSTQINDFARLGGRKSLEIAEAGSRLANAPSAAQLAQAAEVPLSVSKGQVERLKTIGLPEGVTITPGRRVKGLNASNIDEFRAAVAELGASGDKVASNLSARLDNLEIPKPAEGVETSESIQEMLATLEKERSDLFGQAVSARMDRTPLQTQMSLLKANRDQLQVRRMAINAQLTGTTENFKAAYVPVDVTSKNVTSIVKERAGGQPGIDLYFEDKRFPAMLEGRVKEIGRQGTQQAGYGNYIVVESIDPKTGKTVDVLYAHLEDGSIKVKEGDLVGVGQQIGKQGGTGSVRSVDGTIASIDFLEPAAKGSKSMTPYGRWSELADELANGIRKGEVTPTATGRAVKEMPAVAPEAIVDAMKAAEEIAPVMSRKAAVEAAEEVPDLINVAARNDITEAIPTDSVVNTAKPGYASLTEMDIRSVAADGEGLALLERVNSSIERGLLYNPAQTLETMGPSYDLAREWLEMGDDALLASIKNISTTVDGNFLMETRGFTATGMVLQELQRQAKDLGHHLSNILKDGDANSATEGVRLVDRMGTMLQLRMLHKQTASGKLREIGYIGENIADGVKLNQSKSKLYQEMASKYQDDIAKDQLLYQQMMELKNGLRKGDPESFRRLQRVASNMSIAHPTKENLNVAGTLMSANFKAVDAAYVMSILSGPVTQARNFWGNFYQTLGHPVQAMLGTVLPGKHNAAVRRQATAAIGATFETFAEITDLIPRLWNKQVQHLDLNVKEYSMWDEELTKNMMRVKAMAEAGELGFAEHMAYATANGLRQFLEMPAMRTMMDMMGTADNFFKVLAGRQVAARRAVTSALEELGDAPLTGKRSAQFGELVANLKDNYKKDIFDADLNLIDDEAKQLAEAFTFQTPISDPFTKRLNDLSSVPLMKTLGLTFIKTPSAILKSSLHLTPGVSTLLKHADQAYKNGDDYYRAMRDGAEAMSYIIGSTAFMMGMSGNVTGAGPLGGAARDRWLMNNKPYTVSLPGGAEFNYQGLEPATFVIGLFADMGSLAFGGRSESENFWAALPGALTSNVVNKSYLTQFSTVAQVLSARSLSDVKKLGENVFRGLVPYAGMRSQVGQIIDPALREVRSQIEPTWSWYLNKNFGLGASQNAPQRLDPVTGDPLTRDGAEGWAGRGMAVINTAVPFGLRFSKERFQKVHQLLESEGVDIDSSVRRLNAQDLSNEEMIEYTKLRAGNGALKKDLLDYFNSDQYLKVDRPESDRQRSEGVDATKTYSHENIMAIVRMHHDRAVGVMEQGLTEVSRGYNERRKVAMEGAIKQEQQYNKSANTLRLQDYPF